MTAVHGEPRPRNLEQGWTVDDSTFGARLALVRQRMSWNIKQAARECGIPAASWGSWENGALPRDYTMKCRLIAERTGCDYGWLLDGPGLSAGEGRFKASFRAARRSSASASHEVLGVSPIGPGRVDSRRPVSAIPAKRRRPQPVRPS